MNASLQLGYNRIGDVTVLVLDESMAFDNVKPLITHTFTQHGYVISSVIPDLDTLYKNMKSSWLDNSPVLNTIHIARENDYQVLIHARTLAAMSKTEAALMMSFIMESKAFFEPVLKFNTSSGIGASTNEQAFRDTWKAVAKIHGAEKTWAACRSIFFKYVRELTGKKTIGNWFKSATIAYMTLEKSEFGISLRKAILGK